MRQREKYISLIAQTTYVPKWMIEKTNADNSQIASINFVRVPYQTISDSSIHIFQMRKFKPIWTIIKINLPRKNPAASVTSVSALHPHPATVLLFYSRFRSLKPEFTATKDVESFLAKNGTEKNYTDVFVPKSKISGARKDSISILPIGGVTGPYLDGPNFELARIMDIKTLPDSVHARHILVAINDPKTNQPKLDDSSAKRKIDSLKTTGRSGQTF